MTIFFAQCVLTTLTIYCVNRLYTARPRAIIHSACRLDPPIKTPDRIGTRNNYMRIDFAADN